ncbi:MAG TPA: 3-phosphoserine/phosphohydroxythreonine transaminase [candidate division Zixibacteria bacterium]|nr:3-phosphoserine/phosphohydroxythreonine transaminase [candidate division Zixibacteria bacterium]MDD4916564.1 3-phosphoserine/phosphohydroxythreonine transaminase [candidate division Zixibacteria bacterium]MDM7974262.1 3-phosphoserine/phosphohydroxythreonine transaminase [candidate division Zixibacteria bacterium]HOD65751.1 3-phosphoserine/phosphohydroxythreonine transaminase [candidate division Zixibacteria bacterium]HPI32389.1 3-phosphoserine/phosphohydroxythreonine transaminase [candidate 
MAHRVYNFNPGPAVLPLEVLETVQKELLDYKGTGMSILESSHRAAEYTEVNDQCIALARELFGLPADYHVLFMTGGASTQFALVPMNFLNGKTGAYIDTGSWSNKAIKEAKIVGKAHVCYSGKEGGYKHIPTQKELDIPADAAYLHMTTNNTIYGTQFSSIPDSKGLPLIADMSSDIASRRLDFTKFDLIYAGAQKNIGPAGVTLVLLRDRLLKTANPNLPTMFKYGTHAEEKSLYNTPPAFGVYVMKLVFEWIKRQGGLAAVEKVNLAKKERVYQIMDLYPDYYRGHCDKESRSWMNITLRLPTEDLEKKFLAEAKAQGFIGLKGHRSVGGIRVSAYNALPLEGVDKLVAFMEKFKKQN